MFVHLRQNSVRKELSFLPKLGNFLSKLRSNFWQNSVFRKFGSCTFPVQKIYQQCNTLKIEKKSSICNFWQFRCSSILCKFILRPILIQTVQLYEVSYIVQTLNITKLRSNYQNSVLNMSKLSSKFSRNSVFRK